MDTHEPLENPYPGGGYPYLSAGNLCLCVEIVLRSSLVHTATRYQSPDTQKSVHSTIKGYFSH